MLDALIPYITAPEKTLVEDAPLIGPIKLQLFGPLVATGVILGWFRGLKFARAKGMDEWFVRDYMWWQILVAFAVGHWVSVIFYFPEQVASNPWVLLQLWNGLSSVGGFFGGFIAMMVFLRKHKQPILPYADLSVYGLLVGWCFGRLGCSIVHDHPGRIADPSSLIAVGPWPDGNYRYDLGLYEFVFTVFMTGYVHLIARDKVFKWRPGFLTGLVAVAYTPFRFGLDFLRTEDLRYGGLTTAQYFTFVFFGAGLWLLLRKPRPADFTWKKAKAKTEADDQSSTAAADDGPPAVEDDGPTVGDGSTVRSEPGSG